MVFMVYILDLLRYWIMKKELKVINLEIGKI